ncbi:TlpA disulfide reductase family protein [Butyricimonas hominis]|uniref:TlpA family protein disulfide reductase n=1 Tax=Butyricimonas hominis TaxID=2763032 RepID=UPI0035143952
MNKILLCVLWFFTTIFNHVLGQDYDSRLTLDPCEVVAGQNLNLTYNPVGGPLEEVKTVIGIVYTYDFYQWKISDVQLELKKDGCWKGSFNVPDNCGCIAFKFQDSYELSPRVIDNNDNKGFVYMVKDHDGKVMPGAYLGWGLFHKPSLEDGFGNYFAEGYEEISWEIMTTWLNREMDVYSCNGRYYFSVMKDMLKKQYGENSGVGINSLLNTLEQQPNLTEKEYIAIYDTYRFDLKNRTKADSMERVLLQKFPHGALARLRAANTLNTLSGDQFMVAQRQFRKDFPMSEWQKHSDPYGFVYRGVYKGLISAFWEAGDYKSIKDILPEMNMAMLSDAYRKTVEFTLRKTDVPATVYVDLSRAMIDQMVAKVNDGSYMERIKYSPKQAEKYARLFLDYYIGIHAHVAVKCGRYEEAVAVKNLLPVESRYDFYPSGNEAYVLSLEKLNRKQEAIDAMKNSARAGMMTPELFHKLRSYYDSLSKRKKKENFNIWLEELKVPEKVIEIKNKLRGKMVNEPYEPFILESHNGGVVNSKDFGNAIVVLDFWALWCGPCIEALSGMQMAVDRFQGDEGVKFYFVLTQDEARAQAIDKLWEKKNLRDMEVLYDAYRPGRSKERDAVFRALKSGPVGIPFKVILKDGKIRYRSQGYGGSPSGLMDEISYVIEMLNEEK